jgi:hypothetical protein
MSSTMVREIFHKAIHREVLVVYVTHVFNGGEWGDWKAYVVPVPGKRHDDEAHRWEHHGTVLDERVARAVWGSLTEHFDNSNLRWRT